MTNSPLSSTVHFHQLSADVLALVAGGADTGDGPKTINPIPIAEQPGPAFPTFGIMGSAPPSAYPGYPDFMPRPGTKK